jgi:hypothetical protein
MDLLSILILIFSSISSQLLKKKITLKKSYEQFSKKKNNVPKWFVVDAEGKH